MARTASVRYLRWSTQAAWTQKKKVSETNGQLRFHGKKWPALLATVTNTIGINYGQLLAMDHFLDLVIKERPVNGLVDSAVQQTTNFRLNCFWVVS